MVSNGVSLIGNYHNINQDNFIAKKFNKGYVVIVSDGLGSKKYSQYGSKKICKIIYNILNSIDEYIELKKIIALAHKKWVKSLKKYDISQCSATMLIAVVYKNKIEVARLGDGLISIHVDDKMYNIYDKKEEKYCNETDCITEKLNENKIEFLEILYKEFKGIIVCSDGIEINMSKINEFTKEFIEEYNKKKANVINRQIKKWISNWPGNDDKTIAYIMENENNE